MMLSFQHLQISDQLVIFIAKLSGNNLLLKLNADSRLEKLNDVRLMKTTNKDIMELDTGTLLQPP